MDKKKLLNKLHVIRRSFNINAKSLDNHDNNELLFGKQQINMLICDLEKELENDKRLNELLDPNCPKCGRHDYGLYGACPTCDKFNISETIKKRLLIKHIVEKVISCYD